MPSREAFVELDRERPGLADQLVVALRAAIVTGRLLAGTRLPSTRDLAVDLGVSRGVVVEAYEQLVAEGRLVSRRGSGTLVAGLAPAAGMARAAGLARAAGSARATGAPPAAADAPASAGPSAGPSGEAPVRVPPPALPLAPGVPALGLFPRTAWRRAYERALGAARDADLGYGDPAGAPRLRAELAGYLGRVRAARVDPADLLLTTGAAQAFALLAGVLAGRGITEIGVEDPGSGGVLGPLRARGVTAVAVPVDADGLDVTAVERSGVRAVLVTPAHQYPTGVVLAPARRTALLAWARRTGGLVVEDDYDAEFRYDREPVGCLQGLGPDVVAYLGTTSKSLAPGLRLGWLAAPPSWRVPLRAEKAAADLGGPVLEQLAFAELLATGGYDRHLRRARRVYRPRRDALVAAVRRHLPGVRISGVAAGLHLVLELPAGTDDTALGAAARAAGLGPVPVSELRVGGDGQPGLVLGYAAYPPDELTRAVARLAALPGWSGPGAALPGLLPSGPARQHTDR